MAEHLRWHYTPQPLCIPVTLFLDIIKKISTKDQLTFPLQDFGLS